MRSSTARLTAAILGVGALFALATVLMCAVGLAGVRSTAATGQAIVQDELTQAAQNGDVGRVMSMAFTTSQSLMLSADATERAKLSTALYEQMIPDVQDALSGLQATHAADSPADLAQITALVTQWSTLRQLLDSPLLSAPGAARQAPAAQISAAFNQLIGQLDEMAVQEKNLASAASAKSEAASSHLQKMIVLTGALVLLGTAGLAWLSVVKARGGIRPTRLRAEFVEALQMAQDEQEAQQLLHRHLERAVPDGLVTVLNRNNSADRLEAVTPIPGGSPLVRTLEQAEPHSCLAVRSGRLHEEDQRVPALLGCSVCSSCPGRSSCLPLTVGGEVIGSVLVNRPSGAAVEHYTIRESVGQAAPVLANLRNLAIAELRAATDSLTGLPNKRIVGDTLKRMLAYASRTSTPMALLMLDLDHFKNINDRFGHPVGDQTLASVGAVLRSTLRASDFSGRNGGEEFAVILPETDRLGAVAAAEKIRAAIAEIAIPGVDVQITVSLGVAVYPDHGIGAEQLERLADSALYVAKRTGRNRVEVAAAPAAEPRPADPAPLGDRLPGLTLISSSPADC